MTASRNSSRDPIDELLPDAVRELIYDYYEEIPYNKCVLLEWIPSRYEENENIEQILKKQGIDSMSAAYIYVREDDTQESASALFYVRRAAEDPNQLEYKQIQLSRARLDEFYKEFKPTSQFSLLNTDQLDRIHQLTAWKHQTRDRYNTALSFFNNIQSGQLKKAAEEDCSHQARPRS